MSDEDSDHQNLFSFKIAFSPKTYKDYVFASDSQEITENWMKALSCCSIGHLRHILSELQKQVQDLDEDEKNQQLNIADDHFSAAKFTKRINPFDEDDNIVSLNGDRGLLNRSTVLNRSQQQLCFSRKPFVELHTYYGMQFQKFFNERSQSKTEIVNDLILL